MKPVLKALALLAVIGLVLAGCDGLFGPSVDTVTADDLADFEGTSTFVSGDGTAEEEKAALESVGEDAGMAAGGMFQAMAEDPDFQSELEELGIGGESMSISPAMFTQVVHNMIAQAVSPRTITSEGSVDDEAKTADFSLTIQDETYNASDVYESTTAAGTGTINLVNVTAELDGTGLTTNTTADMEYGTVTGGGTIETDISYTGWTTDGVVIINDAQINSDGNAEFEVTIDDGTNSDNTADDIYTASWDITYVLSAGASISNTDTGEGGKFILSFSYNESNDLEVDLSDPESFESATSTVSAELVVDLYDNDGNLVNTYTWTDDDFL